MKVKNITAIILILMMSAVIISCGSSSANQNVIPHDLTSKILSDLNISAADLSPETEEIIEYYNASEDYYLDTLSMSILFPYIGDANDLTGDDFAGYSVIDYNKTVKFPFELVIVKLPKSDGKVDADLVTSVQSLCQAKLDALATWIDQYAPEQTNTVKKASVQTYDNYVYYCVADKSADAENIIKTAITAAE